METKLFYLEKAEINKMVHSNEIVTKVKKKFITKTKIENKTKQNEKKKV